MSEQVQYQTHSLLSDGNKISGKTISKWCASFVRLGRDTHISRNPSESSGAIPIRKLPRFLRVQPQTNRGTKPFACCSELLPDHMPRNGGAVLLCPTSLHLMGNRLRLFPDEPIHPAGATGYVM